MKLVQMLVQMKLDQMRLVQTMKFTRIAHFQGLLLKRKNVCWEPDSISFCV